MPGLDIFQEADRQLTICNACRYCEGYCAVFPALELRQEFKKGDVLYLAHLCHECRACFYACMYAPPHEFAINIPQILSEVRVASYERWSWPNFLARSFSNRWIGVALAVLTAAFVVVLSLTFGKPGRIFAVHTGPGAFYEIVPYLAMVISGMALAFYALAIWLIGSIRFWRESGTAAPRGQGLTAFARAALDALVLRNLDGGGQGCPYPEEKPSSVRRVYHSFVSWGFFAALVSTTLAAIYQDFLGLHPPYSVTSAPVIFGSIGGVAMIIGTAGLAWYKFKSDSVPAATGAATLDFIFLGILGLVSLSGMLTLVLRATVAMGSMLAIHLGLVAAMFVTAPYGKFVHLVYRCLALVRHHLERVSSQP